MLHRIKQIRIQKTINHQPKQGKEEAKSIRLARKEWETPPRRDIRRSPRG